MTPAGTAVLRLVVDCAERSGELAMPVVITGDEALRLKTELRRGDEVGVEGTLKEVRRTLPSGMIERKIEVMARSVSRGK